MSALASFSNAKLHPVVLKLDFISQTNVCEERSVASIDIRISHCNCACVCAKRWLLCAITLWSGREKVHSASPDALPIAEDWPSDNDVLLSNQALRISHFTSLILTSSLAFSS
jgi:hypothetical protein